MSSSFPTPIQLYCTPDPPQSYTTQCHQSIDRIVQAVQEPDAALANATSVTVEVVEHALTQASSTHIALGKCLLPRHRINTNDSDSVYCNGQGHRSFRRPRDSRWIQGSDADYRSPEPEPEWAMSPGGTYGTRAARRRRESERAWRSVIDDDQYINYPATNLRDPGESSILRRRRRRRERERELEIDSDEELVAPPRSPISRRRRNTTGPYRSIRPRQRQTCDRCDGSVSLSKSGLDSYTTDRFI